MVQIKGNKPISVWQYEQEEACTRVCVWTGAEQSMRSLNLPSRTESPGSRRREKKCSTKLNVVDNCVFSSTAWYQGENEWDKNLNWQYMNKVIWFNLQEVCICLQRNHLAWTDFAIYINDLTAKNILEMHSQPSIHIIHITELTSNELHYYDQQVSQNVLILRALGYLFEGDSCVLKDNLLHHKIKQISMCSCLLYKCTTFLVCLNHTFVLQWRRESHLP